MFVRDRQVVDFQGAHVRLDGFLHIGQRGILRFPLGDAAGQAGALGDPKAIFPAIDENLSHTFIMPDSVGSGRNPWPRWAWTSCSGLLASPGVNRHPPRPPRHANRPGREGRGRGLEPSLSPRFPAGTAVRVRFGRGDGSQVLHVPKQRWRLWASLSSPFRINSFASVSGP
jgi:hypothetical protein